MSQVIDQKELKVAHASATAIVIWQLRQVPDFDTAEEKHLAGLMSLHMHLMLVALKAAEASPEEAKEGIDGHTD